MALAVTIDNPTTFIDKLNTTHRCDRCGAQALAQLLVDEELSILLFCGHHWRKYKDTFDSNLYSYEIDKENAW